VLCVIHRFKDNTKSFIAGFASVMDGSVSAIYRARRTTKLSRPLFESELPAGFPSPAEDYVEERIDLNRDLIFHPSYTYYARIAGDSMIGEGLNNGCIVALITAVLLLLTESSKRTTATLW
jgi:SOS-response transcriptional repressor LexA